MPMIFIALLSLDSVALANVNTEPLSVNHLRTVAKGNAAKSYVISYTSKEFDNFVVNPTPVVVSTGGSAWTEMVNVPIYHSVTATGTKIGVFTFSNFHTTRAGIEYVPGVGTFFVDGPSGGTITLEYSFIGDRGQGVQGTSTSTSDRFVGKKYDISFDVNLVTGIRVVTITELKN